MPCTLSFFIAEDELSDKIVSMLNDLIRKVKDSAKIRYSESVGISMTSVRISLKSALGREDTLELRIHSMLGTYVDSFKLRYGLPGIPAVKLGEVVRWGSDAVETTSKIYSLLVGGGASTAEQLFYSIVNYMQGPREVREIPKERVVLRATIALKKSGIQDIAESLIRDNPDITGCVILDEKGAIVACSIPPEMDEEKVSTVFATLRSAAEKTAQYMALEKMNQFVILAEGGGAFLQRHGDLFLLVFMKPDAKLGAVLMELGYAIERLEQITKAGY
jgi:predicted regulator of Ras-like GTPase activity (Roadblock/LC7/MglB family)